MNSLKNFSFDGCFSMHNLRSRAELPFLWVTCVSVWWECISIFPCFFSRCTIQMKYQNAHEFGRNDKKATTTTTSLVIISFWQNREVDCDDALICRIKENSMNINEPASPHTFHSRVLTKTFIDANNKFACSGFCTEI